MPRYLSNVVVTPWSMDSLGVEIDSGTNGVPTSAVWTANLATYFPWYVQEPVTVTEVVWLNGAAAAGNVAVGIYNTDSAFLPSTKIVSCTATAQSGTNAIQTAALTDTLITPGLKWIALWSSSTGSAGTFFRGVWGTASIGKALCVCSEIVTSDLPGTATPIAVSHSAIPVFGVFASPRTLV